jgi:magnesium chelatase subunit D
MVFPFAAVVGQADIKLALLLNTINPRVGGVLIAGEKGAAKSTLVRGLVKLLDGMEVVELPLNATEDKVVGGIDIEHALGKGVKRFEAGILSKAHGNILYIDEVNLLSESLVSVILDAAASGVSVIEREGISHKHLSQFVLVGTMNPEEGSLSPQFLDRFGLYVSVGGEKDVAARVEVMRRRLAYELNMETFFVSYEQESLLLREKIAAAKAILPAIEVSDAMLQLAAAIAHEANCAGHRADIILVETAKALAAWEQRTAVFPKDLEAASRFVLPHRLRETPPVTERQEEQPEERIHDEPSQQQQTEAADTESAMPEQSGQSETKPESAEEDNDDATDGQAGEDKEQVEAPDAVFAVRDIVLPLRDKRVRKGSGRRCTTRTGARQGRYVKVRLPKGKITDLAFDATLRAAAPFQRIREKKDAGLVIHNEDFRVKVREKRVGNTFLFVVDASGSMAAKQRMRAVKGAILSLLTDAYQKRDKVGMIAFRKNTAELLLGITRSVDLAQKRLRDLPTGGKTPLAAALLKGMEVLHAARLRDPDMVPVLVLVSDGKANVKLSGSDAVQEALDIACKISKADIQTLVIDTENDFIRLGLAKDIAQAMDARYLLLEELGARQIAQAVRNSIT